MKTRKIPAIAIVVIITIGIISYLHRGNEQKRDDAIIRIGAVLPLSGNLAQLGESGKAGLLLAEEYINSKNGKRIKIYFEDGKGNPTASVNATNKLIVVDKIDIMFSIISAVELSIVPIQEKYKFLMFSHSSHPELSGVNNLFFRHSQTVQQESDFIISNMDDVSPITLCYMQDDYGIAFENEMRNKLRSDRIKASISFLSSETNFSTIAHKIKDSQPDKVVICAGGRNISNLVKKLREQNYGGEIITTLAYIVSGANATTKDINGLSMIDFKPINMDKEFGDFVHRYENDNGKKIGTAELMFFDSAWIVYANSVNGNAPNEISSAIKKQTTQDILGNFVTVTDTNDILPELIFIKQRKE
ncbi:MAG: ABC transporter substrate-binding protein [Planctomycetota bacterium]|jgi:branched-chain amino acid transport system substrate-binding protein|nr:ABC transporter substrate-binding protein [Planctomycetota bacterium]